MEELSDPIMRMLLNYENASHNCAAVLLAERRVSTDMRVGSVCVCVCVCVCVFMIIINLYLPRQAN